MKVLMHRNEPPTSRDDRTHMTRSARPSTPAAGTPQQRDGQPLALQAIVPCNQPADAFHRRTVWATNRFWMQTENLKTRRYGNRTHHHWYFLRAMTTALGWAVRAAGLHSRGRRNAETVVLREVELDFPHLPACFDGLTILHLTDLHLDMLPGQEQRILTAIDGHSADLCVLGGDYRAEVHGEMHSALAAMGRLVRGLASPLGVVAILGNHDDCHMVPAMEAMGIRVLINEAVRIERPGGAIRLIGLDDVHYYYTDQAVHALHHAAEGFTVGLVHSPEAYDYAAEAGVDLYLTGHTHGGQVCLPGGIPLVRHLSRARRYYRGLWRYKGMVGLTNLGAGVSGQPIRFNTRSEAVLVRLRRRPA
jgi:hypothetical protein